MSAARPPTREDAEAVVALVCACDVADHGAPDYDLGALLGVWAEPGAELSDVLLIHADHGRSPPTGSRSPPTRGSSCTRPTSGAAGTRPPGHPAAVARARMGFEGNRLTEERREPCGEPRGPIRLPYAGELQS